MGYTKVEVIEIASGRTSADGAWLQYGDHNPPFSQADCQRKSVPLSLSLAPVAHSYHDALSSRAARANGHIGQDADEVLREMKQILQGTES